MRRSPLNRISRSAFKWGNSACLKWVSALMDPAQCFDLLTGIVVGLCTNPVTLHGKHLHITMKVYLLKMGLPFITACKRKRRHIFLCENIHILSNTYWRKWSLFSPEVNTVLFWRDRLCPERRTLYDPEHLFVGEPKFSLWVTSVNADPGLLIDLVKPQGLLIELESGHVLVNKLNLVQTFLLS